MENQHLEPHQVLQLTHTHTHTHTQMNYVCRLVSLPLPGFGFSPGAFEQVTLDDVSSVGTRADHRLS